tara:strand:- start:1716 stop:3104 length:1389 start_codon:yes stop_codon:yes gene_type:complete
VGIAITTVLALAKGGAGAAKFLASGDGKKWLDKLKDNAKKKKSRYLLYKAKYENEKDPKAKKRWKKRMLREKVRWEKLADKERLAELGIIGKGPTLEYKRNLIAAEWDELSTEWETATPERQAAIEKRQEELEPIIKKMDRKLKVIVREAKVSAQYQGEKSRGKRTSKGKLKLPSKKNYFPSVAIVRNEKINQALVSGVGGLQFEAQSPPGPGRLVRIPFYAVDPANQWVAAGIEEPGDCPVTRLALVAGQRILEIPLTTRILDYGRYRILGIQTNWERTYPFTGDAPGPPPIPFLGQIPVSLRNLEVYNGAELFVTEDVQAMDAATFAIFRSSAQGQTFGLGGSGPFAQVPSRTFRRRFSRFFTGFQDNPVVGSSSRVTVTVQYWCSQALPAGCALALPFSCNLVAEMIEDRVFGNPAVPSASARKGAQVKLSATKLGQTSEGRERLQIQSSGYIPDEVPE